MSSSLSPCGRGELTAGVDSWLVTQLGRSIRASPHSLSVHMVCASCHVAATMAIFLRNQIH